MENYKNKTKKSFKRGKSVLDETLHVVIIAPLLIIAYTYGK